MAAEVPNMWPIDQIEINVQSPVAILRAQAEHLRQLTQEMLTAELETVRGEDGWLQHRYFLVAPSLNFRQRMLLAMHREDMVYPVRLEAECFLPGPPNEPVDSPPLSATEREFLENLGQVFRSRQVWSLMQSLLARCNEARK
jgi:hypothetical protein